jgi:predicted amino acid dehydrogenase
MACEKQQTDSGYQKCRKEYKEQEDHKSMMGRIRDGKEQLVKTVKRLADKDNYHISMPNNSFRDFWSRQSYKGRAELIATAVAALAAGFIVFYLLLR